MDNINIRNSLSAWNNVRREGDHEILNLHWSNCLPGTDISPATTDLASFDFLQWQLAIGQ